jgi:hypothetical protein
MKHTSSTQKTLHKNERHFSPAVSAGPNGIAIAPPAYGMEVVDHQPIQAALESRQGYQPLESVTWPMEVRAIQRKVASPGLGSSASAGPQENRTGLPDNLKAGIESLSGLSMDDVRVHYNSSKPAQLQALAYTQGTEIHVGPRQERHLPHEAWHVVQQKQGRVTPTMQMKGCAINNDVALEREAAVMGARALAGSAAVPTQFERYPLMGVSAIPEDKAEKESLPRSELVVPGDHDLSSQTVAGQGRTSAGILQRLCARCSQSEVEGEVAVPRRPIIQMVTECQGSDHYEDFYHRLIYRKYYKEFGRGTEEYAVKDSGSWRYIDIADETDKEIYEIKSNQPGAAQTASDEAKYYKTLLNKRCGGGWTLGQCTPDWDLSGLGEDISVRSPRRGAIVYDIVERPLSQ